MKTKILKIVLNIFFIFQSLSLYSQYHENIKFTNFIFFGKRIEDFIDENHLDYNTFKELYSMNYRTMLVFNEKGRNLIEETKKNASKFLNDIKDLQIYI